MLQQVKCLPLKCEDRRYDSQHQHEMPEVGVVGPYNPTSLETRQDKESAEKVVNRVAKIAYSDMVRDPALNI